MELRYLARVSAAVCVGLLAVTLGSRDLTASGDPTEVGADARLPDLDQETPSRLDVSPVMEGGRRTWVLGFASAMRNIGAGPVEIEGNRLYAGDPGVMRADQLVVAADGSRERVPGVGELEFVRSPDHDHWHLVGFDRYELRAADTGLAMARDRKSGFCLGDRYRVVTRVVTDAADRPVYTGDCGPGDPSLTHVVEGISVGFGDVYAPYLEYQDLPLEGLPGGRYVLVHEVNADHSLRETTYANNASSLLLRLRWRDGTPSLRVLASCPDTDRCDQIPRVRVRTVATGLEVPWDLAFLPSGRALVTERPGRVRLLLRDGRLVPDPVAQPDVVQRGEGGLLGLAIDPEFASNHFVYLYLTGAVSMELQRWRWTGHRLVPDATVLDTIEAGDLHDSGRIEFGPDGRLYVATGDAGRPALAQDPDSPNGKILALTPDEYRGTAPVHPAVVARGLRNPQGLDWQPGTGQMFANDHGPSGFDGPEGYDEVNRIVDGGNYGWPAAISDQTDGDRYLPPARIYLDPIAPSGAAFLSRPGPWQGDYVLAALRGESLHRLVLEGDRVVGDQPLLAGAFGRLRSVTEAPDGSLYVLTSNRDGRGVPSQEDDRILRVLLPSR
jgi:glucose/arabinose dehydrogenase